MITVEPMLDEPAIAHEWRRMHILGCDSRKEHLDQMRQQFQGAFEDGREISRLQLLALASRMDTVGYAHRHSMLAALRVTSFPGEAKPHGSGDNDFYTSRLGMQVQRDGGYFCNDCVDEDLSGKFQTSWFRRAHQLIGVDWCHRHGGLLQKVESPSPFDGLPHHRRAEGQATQLNSCCKHLPADGFLRRFVDVAVGLLDRPSPVSCLALNQIISDRAKDIGLRGSQAGTRPLVSDRLLDLTDHDWLQRHIAGFEGKVRGTKFSRVDMIVTRHVRPAPGDGYALVLSTVYDTAKEALEALDTAELRERGEKLKPRTTVVRRYGSEFWQAPVWADYLACDGLPSQMAAKLQLRPSQMAGLLTQIGLPSLVGVQADRHWEALLSFAEGEPFQVAFTSAYPESQSLESLLRLTAGPVAAAVAVVARRAGLSHLLQLSDDDLKSSQSRVGQITCPDTEERRTPVDLNGIALEASAAAYWHSAASVMYLECNGNLLRLADRLSLNRNHLADKLQSIGLPSLAGIQSNPRWKALLHFQRGATLEAACALEGIVTQPLEQLLRVCATPVVTAVKLVRLRLEEGGSPAAKSDGLVHGDPPLSRTSNTMTEPELEQGSTLPTSTTRRSLDRIPRQGKPIEFAEPTLQLRDLVAES